MLLNRLYSCCPAFRVIPDNDLSVLVVSYEGIPLPILYIFNFCDKNINIHSNILEDLNFHLDNTENPLNLHLHEQNISFIKPEKNNINNENITNDIIDYINKITIMPFTIQRIAELLLEPEKYYSSLLKYNRAFNKLVNMDFY